MKSYRSIQRGFTLVEILIVVIILGILAAIVIPQFSNASEDARNSSVVSQLQTLRSQLELYKLQHRDTWPTADGKAASAWDWDKLVKKTNEDGTTTGTPNFGPYLQQTPKNPLNGYSDVKAAAGASVGFVFDSTTGKISATNKAADAVYSE